MIEFVLRSLGLENGFFLMARILVKPLVDVQLGGSVSLSWWWKGEDCGRGRSVIDGV